MYFPFIACKAIPMIASPPFPTILYICLCHICIAYVHTRTVVKEVLSFREFGQLMSMIYTNAHSNYMYSTVYRLTGRNQLWKL